MKKIQLTLVLLTLAVMSFSQPYYVYTAITSGSWSVPANWNTQLRTDGVNKNKFVIPSSVNMTIGNGSNAESGDVEIYIAGNMILASSANVNLSAQSFILLMNGSITGNSANQKIKIGSTIKYKGNVDGVQSGYLIMDNTTGSSPNGFYAYGLLPVNFTNFFISKTDQNIQLSWSTDKEINNSHFEVERSFNGLNWEKIAVIVGSENDKNNSNYSYSDKEISRPVVYYRIRQVDIDGRSVYTSIKTIRTGEAISPLKIYGSEKNIIIDFNTTVKSKIVVSVANNSGQVITRKSYSNSSYKINLNLSGVPSGLYIVQVTDNEGRSEVKKVIL